MSIQEILAIGYTNPFLMAWLLIINGGWIITIPMIWHAVWYAFRNWRIGVYKSGLTYVLLAVDIPKNNEQGPKAVENFFAQIAGAHGSMTLYEKYWQGRMQAYFSLEIVSVAGNIQFLIRTETKFRDLVEASIYAQYPDAEIAEVEDYVFDIPKVFPNETHQLMGTEFTLANKNYCYPIKTYVDFEDQLSQEFKDPMAAFMQTMSSLVPGEQVWFQIVVTPIDHNTWREPCNALMKKLAGQKAERKKNIWESVVEGPAKIVTEAVDQFISGPRGPETKSSAAIDFGALRLSPTDIEHIKAIDRKISKIAFDVKMRLVYIATNETYNTAKVVNPLVGALKQYTNLDLNSFKPDLKKTATRAYYILVKFRKALRIKKLLSNYRSRHNFKGSGAMKLNIEELATVYHFPTIFVKVPTVQQTVSKKYEAPMHVPYDLGGGKVPFRKVKQDELEREPSPPDDLPMV